MTRQSAALCIGIASLILAIPGVAAQRSSQTGGQGGSAGDRTQTLSLPYVNSGGLRLRDFPSTREGAILALLSEGTRLEVSAVTDWRDRIGGSAFPWYRVSLRDGSGRGGWVYGEFLTFEPGHPSGSPSIRTVSRQQMNRPLLVLQLFRRLLGADTHEVATSTLHGLREVSASRLPQSFLTDYSLRGYLTSFGEIIVRYNPVEKHQLVLSMTVDRRVEGPLIAVGQPLSRVEQLLGGDYYRRGRSLYYRGIPGVDTYGVTIQSENGDVAVIEIAALVE